MTTYLDLSFSDHFHLIIMWILKTSLTLFSFRLHFLIHHNIMFTCCFIYLFSVLLLNVILQLTQVLFFMYYLIKLFFACVCCVGVAERISSALRERIPLPGVYGQ